MLGIISSNDRQQADFCAENKKWNKKLKDICKSHKDRVSHHSSPL